MIRLFILCLLMPVQALACACCAERGTRETHLLSLEAFEQSEFARLQADSEAWVFQTACGLECVKGIETPQDSYDVTLGFSPGQVVFDMGTHGALVFEMPGTYLRSDVDTSPSATASAPAVYTELRMVGVVTGSQDFAGVGPNQAVLVLSGFGNMCLSADSLRHWSLEVRDEEIAFQLFGALQAQ